MTNDRYKKQTHIILSNLVQIILFGSAISVVLNILSANYILTSLLVAFIAFSLILLKKLKEVIDSFYKDQILLAYSILLLLGIVVDFIQNSEGRLGYVWILLIPFIGYMVNGIRYQVWVTAFTNLIILIIHFVKNPFEHTFPYYLEVFNLLLIMAIFWLLVYHYEKIKYNLTDKLDKTLTIDPLTKLKNRESLYTIYTHYKNKTMTLIIIDIKGIKEINDRYGYLAGDVSLINVAQNLMDSNIKNSHNFRFGDDEFAVLVTNKDSESCLPLVRDLYAKLDTNKTIFKNEVMETIISVAVASIESDGQNLDRLMQSANNLLKQAKKSKNDKIAI